MRTSIREKMTIAPTARQPVEQNKGSPRASSEQVATDSRNPKLTKAVQPEKHDEKHLSAARNPEKVVGRRAIRCTEKADELTISEYVFGKVEDVDDSDKEVTRASIATLKPGGQLKMNVINIWSNILNDWERKRDLATLRRFFMSGDQSVSASS
ncbi:hypothetical protein Cgig2_032957 [Carnegiea gigantea]|uniref:Uncharacterized protein n=1 Tax=Carnegiea gigantea TaxID=171969 RepID=A0A9Q1JNL9_9CARY|nr:hypothetical protein Cgig2_032957 [Carnegiea gigantea]